MHFPGPPLTSTALVTLDRSTYAPPLRERVRFSRGCVLPRLNRCSTRRRYDVVKVVSHRVIEVPAALETRRVLLMFWAIIYEAHNLFRYKMFCTDGVALFIQNPCFPFLPPVSVVREQVQSSPTARRQWLLRETLLSWTTCRTSTAASIPLILILRIRDCARKGNAQAHFSFRVKICYRVLPYRMCSTPSVWRKLGICDSIIDGVVRFDQSNLFACGHQKCAEVERPRRLVGAPSQDVDDPQNTKR